MMNPKFKEYAVRDLSESDLIAGKKEIVSLLRENLSTNFRNAADMADYAISYYEDMIRYYKDRSAMLFGAFDDKLIGLLWAYRREFLGERRIHISQIIVNRDYRHCGIGTALLDKLEAYALKEGIRFIELMATLDNATAMNFYKGRGFAAVRVQLEKELGARNEE